MSDNSIPNNTNSSPTFTPQSSALPGAWILNSRLDLLLFLLSPLLIVAVIQILQARWIGVEAKTIGLAVAAFGALGHHLPGMIRIYCDRDLFQRFRLRFLLVPPLLFAVYFPLSQYHRSYMTSTLMIWGCWHGLMQVYGFVRIYDIKVGSISPTTANLDWLMCLCWFSTAEVFSNNKPNVSGFLQNWYHIHGVTPPVFVQMFGWICVAVSLAVTIVFFTNHVIQAIRGPKPNSIKLLMLASGIGFWWFATVYIENAIVGVALFEVFHDVQYLAIVWLYNCRRVNSNPAIGSIMRFVFRRGMLMLYIGLVFLYGLIAFASDCANNETVKAIVLGLIWTSTILHFYVDGFIWKARERSTQVTLGLKASEASSQNPKLVFGELPHLAKWSPLILLLGWLLYSDMTSSLPLSNRADQKREAVEFLETLLKQNPSHAFGYQRLGEIHKSNGELDKAVVCFQSALEHASSNLERSWANLRLGEIFVSRQQYESAIVKFREALQDDPAFIAAKTALLSIDEKSDAPE